jgi:hypothetical protein
MSVIVTMKGALESVELDEGFQETMNTLNMTAIQGKTFVASRTKQGEYILLNIENILTVRENDSALASF